MNRQEEDLYNGPLPPHSGEPAARQLGWLAGFTDGEGTITLAVTTRGEVKAIHPQFSLTNTNLENLGRARVLLASITGHDVRIKPIKNVTDNRPAYVIALGSHFDVKVTLESLYPYLVGKWPQASVVLEYMRIAPGRLKRSTRGGRARRMTPRGAAIFDERHWALVDKTRALNRRYAPGQWRRTVTTSPGAKPDDWPGYEPMDPLKRWYKLYVG